MNECKCKFQTPDGVSFESYKYMLKKEVKLQRGSITKVKNSLVKIKIKFCEAKLFLDVGIFLFFLRKK